MLSYNQLPNRFLFILTPQSPTIPGNYIHYLLEAFVAPPLGGMEPLTPLVPLRSLERASLIMD